MEPTHILGLLVVAGIAYAVFRAIKARANPKAGSGGKGSGGGKDDGTEHF